MNETPNIDRCIGSYYCLPEHQIDTVRESALAELAALMEKVKSARNAALEEAVKRAKCIRDNKVVCGEHTVAEAISFVIDSINNLKEST